MMFKLWNVNLLLNSCLSTVVKLWHVQYKNNHPPLLNQILFINCILSVFNAIFFPYKNTGEKLINNR